MYRERLSRSASLGCISIVAGFFFPTHPFEIFLPLPAATPESSAVSSRHIIKVVAGGGMAAGRHNAGQNLFP